MKFLLIVIAFAFLFNMLAKYIIPMFTVSASMNQHMKKMQDKMNEMEQNMNKQNKKSARKNREGDYIDYEEVK